MHLNHSTESIFLCCLSLIFVSCRFYDPIEQFFCLSSCLEHNMTSISIWEQDSFHKINWVVYENLGLLCFGPSISNN